MRDIIIKIRYMFWFFFIRPIKKVWNYFFNNRCIIDNSRNQEILEFCRKICADSNYVASTPVEIWIEMKWEESYINYIKTLATAHNVAIEEYPPFSACRPLIASNIGIKMLEHIEIKDR